MEGSKKSTLLTVIMQKQRTLPHYKNMNSGKKGRRGHDSSQILSLSIAIIFFTIKFLNLAKWICMYVCVPVSTPKAIKN